jgi:hypothetical protein
LSKWVQRAVVGKRQWTSRLISPHSYGLPSQLRSQYGSGPYRFNR